ncbi:MAG: glycerate kinase [Planctomycetales bacterium 71-10]|nr:MAG: glycerate kinase [Planctomycetales bacterium 71-10]
MRVVIAPDKFKGSLSAPQVVEAVARGVRAAEPSTEIVGVPMADGGEGLVDALAAAGGGEIRRARVTGPLGDPVDARFALFGDGTAAAEMASAAGLVLVPKDRRDPGKATTRGVGELLRAIVEAGARRIILGIGGSATNDGGAGMAQALGYRLLDAEGRDVEPGGFGLEALDRIEPAGGPDALRGVQVSVACDVTNPLCGPTGASAVYGPQKGATPEMVGRLDRALRRLADVVARDLHAEIADVPGAGAAGGLGGGLMAFAGGRLKPGIDLVIHAVKLRDKLDGADLCITGEGSLDAQSAYGKTAVGVARLACSLGVPTFALVGSIGDGAEACLNEGLDAYFPICPGPTTLDEAMARASDFLAAAAEQAMRGFLAGAKSRGSGR